METLKVALPLIAKQDIAVVQKMIKFLKLVSAAAESSESSELELELESTFELS